MDTVKLLEILASIVIAGLMSSGFWLFMSKLNESRGLERKLLMGIAHDRIIWLEFHFLEKGQITRDEFENLHDYLFVPYKELGGNGTAERVMTEVKKLQIIESRFEKAMHEEGKDADLK
jgi:hypothetical protein